MMFLFNKVMANIKRKINYLYYLFVVNFLKVNIFCFKSEHYSSR